MSENYSVFWGKRSSCDVLEMRADSAGKLWISLEFHSDRLKKMICFNGYEAVFSADEGFQLRTTALIAGTNGQILLMKNSPLITWLKEESHNARGEIGTELRHWLYLQITSAFLSSPLIIQ